MSTNESIAVFVIIASVSLSIIFLYEYVLKPAYFESYEQAMIDFNATRSCGGLQLLNDNLDSYGMKNSDKDLMKIAIVKKAKELCK